MKLQIGTALKETVSLDFQCASLRNTIAMIAMHTTSTQHTHTHTFQVIRIRFKKYVKHLMIQNDLPCTQIDRIAFYVHFTTVKLVKCSLVIKCGTELSLILHRNFDSHNILWI